MGGECCTTSADVPFRCGGVQTVSISLSIYLASEPLTEETCRSDGMKLFPVHETVHETIPSPHIILLAMMGSAIFLGSHEAPQPTSKSCLSLSRHELQAQERTIGGLRFDTCDGIHIQSLVTYRVLEQPRYRAMISTLTSSSRQYRGILMGRSSVRCFCVTAIPERCSDFQVDLALRFV